MTRAEWIYRGAGKVKDGPRTFSRDWILKDLISHIKVKLLYVDPLNVEQMKRV